MNPPTYRLTLVEVGTDIILDIWEFADVQEIPHDLEQEIRRNVEANNAVRRDM